MLAQGQSSSAKRGGLATDVSSGLIFLKKKKEKTKRKTLSRRWSRKTWKCTEEEEKIHLLSLGEWPGLERSPDAVTSASLPWVIDEMWNAWRKWPWMPKLWKQQHWSLRRVLKIQKTSGSHFHRPEYYEFVSLAVLYLKDYLELSSRLKSSLWLSKFNGARLYLTHCISFYLREKIIP